MAQAPHILVTAGPDQGRSFPLTEELIHIGRAAENQVVLSEKSLEDHQFSLVLRNGRFAVFSPLADALSVDGNAVPAERWVWVPDAAVIHCGYETSMVLKTPGVAASLSGELTPPVPGGSSEFPVHKVSTEGSSASVVRRSRSGARRNGPGTERSRRSSRRDATESSVARFITDQPGEPLVRLGADGHLPELQLEEFATADPAQKTEPADSNPLVLYGLLACSVVLSLGLLLLEPTGSGTSAGDTQAARHVLEQHYGDADDELAPYQILLRQALVAHSRGDRREEQQMYRQVLRLLNSADVTDRSNLNGLTGHVTRRGRASDDELRESLQTLLAQ